MTNKRALKGQFTADPRDQQHAVLVEGFRKCLDIIKEFGNDLGGGIYSDALLKIKRVATKALKGGTTGTVHVKARARKNGRITVTMTATGDVDLRSILR